MVGMMPVPSPHMVSLHTTGPPYLTKRRAISMPGRSSRPGFRDKKRLHLMWTAKITSSTPREMRVAKAAPSTPMAGAPRLPKISIQFRNVLHPIETIRIYIPSWGRSMAR